MTSLGLYDSQSHCKDMSVCGRGGGKVGWWWIYDPYGGGIGGRYWGSIWESNMYVQMYLRDYGKLGSIVN